MKRIVYADRTLLTDGRLALTVLDYARALAVSEAADTVTLPTVDDDGAVQQAAMLLGPASQIIVIDTDLPDRDDLGAEPVIADIEVRLHRLQPGPVAYEPEAPAAADPIDDLG